MHHPRFAHPHYILHQNLGPQGFGFRPMWPPIQYQNHPRKVYLNRQSNFPNNNEEHWCETCDRGFRTPQLLENHKQQHQKCNIDGCQFIAHPKVITKHIQMQHSTGLYKKIAKLDSPEDIQKWREERKRRYPTKENIEKKGAEIKEKIDRGEKMGMRCNNGRRSNRTEHMKRKYSHDMNRQNFKRRHQKGNGSIDIKRRKVVDVNIKRPAPKRENIPIISHVNDSKTLKAFTGILHLMDDIDNDNVKENIEISDPIEDDDYITINEPNEKHNSPTEPILCGALTSLISNYESSDEDVDHDTTVKQNNKSDIVFNSVKHDNESAKPEPENEGPSSKDTSINVDKSDDDSGPEEVKIVKAVEIEKDNDITSCKKETSIVKFSKNIDPKNSTKNAKNNFRNFRPKLPSTLLEKLLHSEIRHERNIILQCIRYIVNNNYFEKSDKS